MKLSQRKPWLFLNAKAINDTINKDRIISTVLNGYGIAIDDPIPPNKIAYQKQNTRNNISREEILKKVQDDLAKNGWKSK